MSLLLLDDKPPSAAYSFRKASSSGPQRAAQAASQLQSRPPSVSPANITTSSPGAVTATGERKVGHKARAAAVKPVAKPRSTNSQCSATTSRLSAGRLNPTA